MKSSVLNPENPKELVQVLYSKCFTVNAHTDVAAVMGEILDDRFQSLGSADTKGKAQLIGQIQFFWKLVPDLKWEVKEILQVENRIVVRSIASGSPRGDFMGLKLDGTKSFQIMTIDIHTVENNQIAQVYHLEDWATAIGQLKS